MALEDCAVSVVSRGRRAVPFGLAVLLVCGVQAAAPAAPASPPGGLQITTLSNRADLISGGEALIQVTLPAGVATSSLHVSLDGRDVTAQFALRPNHKVEALLRGLALGANSLVATSQGGRRASLTILDHPTGGPAFSGPQIQPWACQSGAADRQCDQAPTFAYSYEPVGTNSLQSYDPSHPPPAASIATATTTDGVTVPFIVRQETGYIDRDQYAIATLWQPGEPWQPWAPQRQYNGRLIITHGASCDTTYGVGTAPSVTDTKMLGGGFILMSTALDNAGHNCNIATEAESLVMTKEHLIDHYGEVRWTIGSGCSGGSLVQQQVANAYPGVYQGITPQCSFTDAWSSAMEYVDYSILLEYFEDPARWSPGTVWDPVAISQVLDHPNIANPITFTTAIPNSADPSRSCPGVPASETYTSKTNPGGVKCTLQDYMVNVFGKRTAGFANRAYGNAGIQYGLQGLLDGELSVAQFVDLNSHIGGLDYNDNVQAARSSPDLTGLDRAYTSGAVDSANNLDQVAIIDLRGPDEGSFHDVYRTYALRARLLRDFGTAANQVLWRGLAPIIGDTNYADQSVFAMDRWVARVDADHSPVALSQKILHDKPGDVPDRCTTGDGTDIPSPVCDAAVAAYGTPRMAAGMPLSDDVLQCQLKPLRKDDYPVSFTDAQWQALQLAFPNGVCDYSKPGVDQHGTTPWLSYQDVRGSVVYGGRPLGPPPRSSSS